MASGYDISSRVPFRLMQGRLGGVYDTVGSQKKGAIEGVGNQSIRMSANGGFCQQDRMIKDKRRSLDRATNYSYQAAKIVRIDAEDQTPVPALINPDKVKLDYDDKILSVGFEYNIGVGDIIQWKGTNTYWLIHIQDSTELAYFRGDMRKCTHSIAWKDDNGEIHTIYAAIKGPKETKIITKSKHGINIDTPNLSLSIIMPKNEYTLAYFKRYSKFYLQGDDTCWKVQATDWVSSPGILEVTALEYYANKDEDDIDTGLVGTLIPEQVDPNEDKPIQIIGETFIKVKKLYDYSFNGDLIADWTIDRDCPVELQVNPNYPYKVKIKWNGSYSGQFDLCYGEYRKTIIVESLF